MNPRKTKYRLERLLARCVEESCVPPGEVAAAVKEVWWRGGFTLGILYARLARMQEEIDDAAEDAALATEGVIPFRPAS